MSLEMPRSVLAAWRDGARSDKARERAASRRVRRLIDRKMRLIVLADRISRMDKRVSARIAEVTMEISFLSQFVKFR